MTGRKTLENLLWEAAKNALFCSKNEFCRSLDGWAIEPIEIGGELAFLTVKMGPKFHFHSLKTGHAMTRRMIVDFLRPIIAEFGYAETKTPHSDDRQHRFNHLIGFECVGEDAFDVIYRIYNVPGA
ncbi:MAG: hypothetical protein ACP5QR_04910 [Rhizomicrobium sp.]